MGPKFGEEYKTIPSKEVNPGYLISHINLLPPDFGFNFIKLSDFNASLNGLPTIIFLSSRTFIIVELISFVNDLINVPSVFSISILK